MSEELKNLTEDLRAAIFTYGGSQSSELWDRITESIQAHAKALTTRNPNQALVEVLETLQEILERDSDEFVETNGQVACEHIVREALQKQKG